MRLRKVVLIVAGALLFVAATAGAGLAWLRYAPRRTPPGQPALSRLDAATLGTFRDAFNDAAEETRVLLLFSPT